MDDGEIKQVEEIRNRIGSLESELLKQKELLAQHAQAISTDLAENRRYAVSAEAGEKDVVEACCNSLERYGFAVVDNVIPVEKISTVREEVELAGPLIEGNLKAIRDYIGTNGGEEEKRSLLQLAQKDQKEKLELRAVRRRHYGPKPPNDIVWMPEYASFLAHPLLLQIAQRMLDEHLKIAQLHLRPIAANSSDGTPGGFGRAADRGRPDTREWHTDWPHDLSAYGAGNAQTNAGCIRQPFPDVPMCLVMIWYLTDVDEDSGGTWVVPGSHRDPRNPRGPSDDITVSAPITGDMQISAKAGSVFIQDSRTWHASAMHNTSGKTRIAVVNRWCPWWMSVDDYAPGGTLNTVCRPLSQEEYSTLPKPLQPLMRHLCPEEFDEIQQPVLDRAEAARASTAWGFEQLRRAPEKLRHANAHVRVPII